VSSIIVLRQRSSVHLMCDGAAYEQPGGILRAVDLKKCHAMPTLSAAVSCTGPALLGAWFGEELPKHMNSFDDLIARASHVLPKLFEEYASEERGGDASSTLYLIGWHSAAKRPAAYSIDLWTDGSSRIAKVLENTSPEVRARVKRNQLEETILAGTPLPGADLLEAAGLAIPDDENAISPEIDLLHLMEVQRHEEIEGRYWVGGQALLTSIDRRGIMQRVVHTWGEDRVGEVIAPLLIDWLAWRTARVASAPIPFISRLRRQMQDRKTKKTRAAS
jgi:hypothetical protein